MVRLIQEQNEYWWGGRIADGASYPVLKGPYSLDFAAVRGANQLQPLFLSSTGRWIWSESAFRFSIEGEEISAVGTGEILTGRAGHTLKDAAQYCSKTFFPPSGKTPDPDLFRVPQYNTWIELMYNQNERDILDYAENLLNEGYPPGVLMIDDTWQEDYGVWNFHPSRFRDPAGMIRTLHEWGFKVMLWVCPFISADSVEYRFLAEKGYLLMEEGMSDILWSNTSNTPAIIRWWNGASAVLDFSNPGAVKWFRDKLDHLQNAYGVDGFKFDAGDPVFYRGDYKTAQKISAEEHSSLYARFGLSYDLNEYRACWKMGGQALAQRLQDKHHNWEDLSFLIPETLTQGLMGYPFTCPDMIGGGEYLSFMNLESIDQELVVRSAQCSALMPMMQFSAAPWRILDETHRHLCLKAARLHCSKEELFLSIAQEAALTGKPIVRSLAYSYPGEGLERVKDQFLVGDEFMVAPVVNKGQYSRTVIFPSGTWRDGDGKLWEGASVYDVEAPLEKILWFEKV